MHLVRSSLFVASAALVGAVTIAAQGPPPQPAPSGVTTARTWTDGDYEKIMKEVGATVGLLRKSIDGQNGEMAKQQADKLEMLFEEADDFWNSRNVDDAQDLADDAAEHADHIEDAVDDKDFTKAAEHMKLMQGTCAACHGKYRDKAPDGTYRIKP
jgi:mono/diheme cytochrome c family protein